MNHLNLPAALLLAAAAALTLALGATALVLIIRDVIASLRPNLCPPTARVTEIPTVPLQGTAMAWVEEGRREVMSASTERLEWEEYTLYYFRRADGQLLCLNAGCLAKDDGATLRREERAWPKWWQRLLFPGQERWNMTFYWIPEAWLPAQPFPEQTPA